MVNRNRILLSISLIAFASACAVRYERNKSFWNFNTGFSIEQIAQDTWTIDFNGNAQNNKAQMLKYVLRKASEIAKQNGFSHFVVTSGSTIQQVSGGDGGMWVGSGSGGSGSGVFVGNGAAVNSNGNITVKLLHGSKGVSGEIYDADFLLSRAID